MENSIMKTIIRSLIFIALTTATLVGCGSKDSGNSAGNNIYCNPAYGYCPPVDPGYGVNPAGKNAIILQGGITVSSSNAYKNLLNGLLGCDNGWINTCSMVNNASPRVEIVMNDYLFGGDRGTTSGSVAIGSQQVPPAPIFVNWKKINSDSAIDTQVLLPYEYDNKFLRVVLLGRATDSTIPIEIYYGNVSNDGNNSYGSKLVGTGIMYRVNR